MSEQVPGPQLQEEAEPAQWSELLGTLGWSALFLFVLFGLPCVGTLIGMEVGDLLAHVVGENKDVWDECGWVGWGMALGALVGVFTAILAVVSLCLHLTKQRGLCEKP
jgi:hypothetical protein